MFKENSFILKCFFDIFWISVINYFKVFELGRFPVKMNKYLKVFPRKDNDLKFVFKSCKGEKWFEICFQMVEVWKNISCKDIFFEK